MAEASGQRLRPRKAELGQLWRATGSSAYAQGETVVWASVFGPGDLRMGKQDPRAAVLALTVRADVPSPHPLPALLEGGGALEAGGNAEAWLRDAIGACLLIGDFPRAQFAIALEQLQGDGEGR